MTTRLAPKRYLELLESDAPRLADVAARGLDADVPSCPDWRVEDLVRHTAVVYLHKVECMRRNAAPDPWAPPDLESREALPLFDEALQTLLAELKQRGPDAPSATWWPADQTSGFWYRRMAQETAIHRVDAELAHDDVTPVDRELAIDGVDEALVMMLGGPWYEPDETPERWSARVRTGDHSWLASLDHGVVTVIAEPGDNADVEVSGEPNDLLLWLWGRGPIDPLQVSGDAQVASELRRYLAMAT